MPYASSFSFWDDAVTNFLICPKHHPGFFICGTPAKLSFGWQRRSVIVVVVNWSTGAHRATLHG
jgi:hypothetical protein